MPCHAIKQTHTQTHIQHAPTFIPWHRGQCTSPVQHAPTFIPWHRGQRTSPVQHAPTFIPWLGGQCTSPVHSMGSSPYKAWGPARRKHGVQPVHSMGSSPYKAWGPGHVGLQPFRTKLQYITFNEEPWYIYWVTKLVYQKFLSTQLFFVFILIDLGKLGTQNPLVNFVNPTNILWFLAEHLIWLFTLRKGTMGAAWR